MSKPSIPERCLDILAVVGTARMVYYIFTLNYQYVMGLYEEVVNVVP